MLELCTEHDVCVSDVHTNMAIQPALLLVMLQPTAWGLPLIMIYDNVMFGDGIDQWLE